MTTYFSTHDKTLSDFISLLIILKNKELLINFIRQAGTQIFEGQSAMTNITKLCSVFKLSELEGPLIQTFAKVPTPCI